MKELLLIRHAKSSWDYSGLSDFERPLNKRGKSDAPLMGNLLRKKGILPDLILSSPATRALNTAVIIAEEIGFNKNIQVNKIIYHAYTPDLWDVVRSTSEEVQSMMLFGHNPSFTEFANELSSTKIDNIPTCGIFSVRWESSLWKDIKKKEADFLFYEFPKNYR